MEIKSSFGVEKYAGVKHDTNEMQGPVYPVRPGSLDGMLLFLLSFLLIATTILMVCEQSQKYMFV